MHSHEGVQHGAGKKESELTGKCEARYVREGCSYVPIDIGRNY